MLEMGCELAGPDQVDLIAEVCGRLGIRAYVTPIYKSATWMQDPAGRITRVWDEPKGLRGLDYAVRFIERLEGRFDGRVRGFLCPGEVALATSDLLHRTMEHAERLKVPISIHAAEEMLEWHLSIADRGVSPITWLADLGFLRPGVILAHAVFIAGHSTVIHSGRNDLETLARSGAAVAHCPVGFARRGLALESFDRYRQAGVRLSLGTDVHPQDMLFELKVGSLVAKVVDRRFDAGAARDIFDAATTGGASALGRTDIGALRPGTKADLVVYRFEDLSVIPVRDPVSTLVHVGSRSDIELVFVDGAKVVEHGRVLNMDSARLREKVVVAARSAWESSDQWVPRRDPLELFSPLTYPVTNEVLTGA
jgi:cytosine/adenosine deaminase-related metal-dependent hydrolase